MKKLKKKEAREYTVLEVYDALQAKGVELRDREDVIDDTDTLNDISIINLYNDSCATCGNDADLQFEITAWEDCDGNVIEHGERTGHAYCGCCGESNEPYSLVEAYADKLHVGTNEIIILLQKDEIALDDIYYL
jgi:hypothetical protein